MENVMEQPCTRCDASGRTVSRLVAVSESGTGGQPGSDLDRLQYWSLDLCPPCLEAVTRTSLRKFRTRIVLFLGLCLLLIALATYMTGHPSTSPHSLRRILGMGMTIACYVMGLGGLTIGVRELIRGRRTGRLLASGEPLPDDRINEAFLEVSRARARTVAAADGTRKPVTVLAVGTSVEGIESVLSK
jgi:hypothetical protein